MRRPSKFACLFCYVQSAESDRAWPKRQRVAIVYCPPTFFACLCDGQYKIGTVFTILYSAYFV